MGQGLCARGTINIPYGIVHNNIQEGVSAKPGLWTLDWTVDWTLDWILDWILDSIIHGPEGIQKTKLVHNKYNTHT